MSDTESFESVYERLYPQLHNPCGLWKAATIAEWLDDLERAHNREIRDVSQREYDRGYHAGQHSMDAEHRAIAMRLRGLRFDGGSHENLARIAYAIYPCATGWTCESAAGLRDKLVDLMGGVSDDTSIGAGSGACADCDGRDSVEQAEVSDDCVDCDILGPDSRGHAAGCDFHELGVSDGRVADDSAADTGCGDGGGDLHMAGVTYAPLWNERHEVVRALRDVPDASILSTYYGSMERLLDAVGVSGTIYCERIDNFRDRLIHLLGGDQPSGIDVLREMDGESDTDGTCPDDDPTPSITDELREFKGHINAGLTPEMVLALRAEINCIADRIDEQFDRICQQHEAVVQSIIEEVVEERKTDRLRIEKLEKQRNEARQECDELRRKVDELESFDHETSIAAFGDDNGKLRMALSRAATLLANAEQDRDANYAYWMDCKEKVVHANVTIEELQAKLDAIRDTLDG